LDALLYRIGLVLCLQICAKGSIPAAERLDDSYFICPGKKAQQLKRRFNAPCASNDSGGYLLFYMVEQILAD